MILDGTFANARSLFQLGFIRSDLAASVGNRNERKEHAKRAVKLFEILNCRDFHKKLLSAHGSAGNIVGRQTSGTSR